MPARQMNPKDTKGKQPGSCKVGYMHDSSENICPEHHHMCAKVEKLLREDYFSKGILLTDDDINTSILMLRKDRNIFNANSECKGFLKEYGSVYGSGFNIYGPISNDYEGHKVDRVILMQNSFIKFGRKLEIGLRLESCWAVTYYKSDFYYIDLSSSGKGHIYRVGFDGRPELFAIDFLDFLENVFRCYELDKLGSVS